MQLLIICGTRPENLKTKSLINIFNKNKFDYKTLFTGQQKDLLIRQHFDYVFKIKDGLSRLDSIVQSIMNKLPKYIQNNKITHVLVQGDTTSALAVALSAFHNNIKVIHLEAGLRTYDKENPYPEELNRQIISKIADIHLCPTENNKNNLLNEGIKKNIFVVGNTGIDNLLLYKDKCEYTNKILITLHRRENHNLMDKWFIEINKLAKNYPQHEFILPIHPNPSVQKHKNLLNYVNVINPLPYEEMLDLLVKTRLVITDSGGIQEECSYFNKKCLVCRVVTERPEAIGKSTFIVNNPNMLSIIFKLHIDDYIINYNCPFGDGYSAERIYEILKNI